MAKLIDPKTAPNSESNRGIFFGLFVFYSVVGGIFVFLTEEQRLKPTSAQLILTLLWLGFVLAISGMEAWVKFRAPFCPRHFALDIGRTIFPALNAVEVALCLSLWVLRRSEPILPSLVILSLVLTFDVFYLTPILEDRGRQMVYSHVRAFGGAKGGQESRAWKNLEKEMGKHFVPSQDKKHLLYIFFEVVKVVGLSQIVSLLV